MPGAEAAADAPCVALSFIKNSPEEDETGDQQIRLLFIRKSTDRIFGALPPPPTQKKLELPQRFLGSPLLLLQFSNPSF